MTRRTILALIAAAFAVVLFNQAFAYTGNVTMQNVHPYLYGFIGEMHQSDGSVYQIYMKPNNPLPEHFSGAVEFFEDGAGTLHYNGEAIRFDVWNLYQFQILSYGEDGRYIVRLDGQCAVTQKATQDYQELNDDIDQYAVVNVRVEPDASGYGIFEQYRQGFNTPDGMNDRVELSFQWAHERTCMLEPEDAPKVYTIYIPLASK